MRKTVLLTLSVLLAGCAPAVTAFDPAARLDPADFGPQRANTEWWYASGYLPESGVSFHWAQFKVNYKGLVYYASHVAVTDLNTGKLTFVEQNSQDARLSFPPLSLRQGDWQLRQQGADYQLDAGPLHLRLAPLKGPVIHPPGYSGTPEVGQMYYQSVTRLALSGTANGREVQGLAWFDHQWGNQMPGRGALWDWFGLHLSSGADLMLYRVKDGSGRVVQTAGSLVGVDGVARAVPDLKMTPLRDWTSPSGRHYSLAWKVEAGGNSLTLDPLRDDQELLSKTTTVAYWEGPVRGEGRWDGQPVRAEGMGEFVGGPLGRAEGGR